MTDDLMTPPGVRPPRPGNRADGDWWRIVRNADDTDSVDVLLYDEIGYWGTEAKDFAQQINALDVSTINLRVNSPGGDVYDGIAILNALRAHPAVVNVIVDGIAASAASFIAMAGDTITMARNSEMMIHDARGFAMGNAATMAKIASMLDRTSNNIASIYAERAGGETTDWRAAMKAETWYSAQEAVDAGLADKVDDPKSDDAKPSNRFDLSVFNYAGRTRAPAPQITAHAEAATQTPAAATADGNTGNPEEGSTIVAFSDESTATLRQKLGVNDDADETAILAALDEALQERAEPQVTNQPPEGVVAIDSAQLEELRNAAEAGRRASERQEREDRERIVDQAITDGRISPARREAWLNRLTADPAEVETLNALEAGLVPVTMLGSARDLDDDQNINPIDEAHASALAAMTGIPKEAFRG